jgi:hypothetical protein
MPMGLARMKDRLPIILAGLAIVASSVIVSIGTRWGPAANDDTFSYIMAAENAARGHGLSIHTATGSYAPLTLWPPMLSLWLVPPVLLGLQPLDALRWLYCLLFGANVVLTAAATRRLTRSPYLPIIAGLLVLISNVMILVYTEAMSDGLFLFLSLATFLVLDRFLSSPRMATLATACLLAAATFLTRYIGGAVLLTGTFMLVREHRRTSKSSAPALLFFVGATVPMAVWLGRNMTLSGNPISRIVGWVPVGQGFLIQAADVVLTWFLPGRVVQPIPEGLIVILAGIAFISGALCLLSYSRRGRGSAQAIPPLLWALAAYIPVYLGCLFISKAAVEHNVPIDNRILSPLFQPLIILLCVGVDRLARASGRIVVSASASALVVLAFFWVYRAWTYLTYSYEWGRGYTSRGYSTSETIATLRRLEHVAVYTNAAAAVYFWTGRVVSSLGPIAETKQALSNPCGVIVLFDAISPELYGTTLDEVAQGLVRVERQDGDLFFDPACAEELTKLIDG